MRRIAALAVFAVLGFMSTAAVAQPLLVPTDSSVRALDLEYYRVEAKVMDGVLSADVKMAFRNHTKRQLEATFIFPLPEGASIGKFKMQMNGQWVEGKVLEKNEAARIYTDIVRRMKDPGLLELVGTNLFQARVFPVPAEGLEKIELNFATNLSQEGGLFKLIYPLKTARNYSGTTKDFTFTLDIKSSTPLRAVYSPSHQVSVSRKGDKQAVVSFEKSQVAFSDDLKVFYSVDYNAVGLSVLTYKQKGEPGYFMILAAPGAKDTADEIPAKKLLFVVDTSGSMQGEKIKRVKAALVYAIERLGDEDLFNIIRFSSDVEQMFPAMEKGTTQAKKEALEFVDQIDAAGGTAIDSALEAGFKLADDPDTIVIFLTDGEPTVGETDVPRILANVKTRNSANVRVFPFGVGDELNTILLDTLARDSKGAPTYMDPDGEIEAVLSSFYDKISHPVLSRIELSVPSVKAYGILPGVIPDLFRGEQLVIVGRFRNSGASLIRLEGYLGDKKKTYDYEAKFRDDDTALDFIPRLWAKRQVAVLLDQIRLEGEKKALVDEVVQLGTTFGIVTPYTSYLITEPGTVAPQPLRPVDRSRREGFNRGNGLGAGGGVDRISSDAPAAEPSARFADGDDESAAAFGESELKEESGKKAVEVAKNLSKMKASSTAKDTGGSVKVLDGKTFRWKDGGWVDEASGSAKGRRIKIKSFSNGYFEIVAKNRKLSRWMALGDKVTVEFKGFILVFGDDGDSELPDDLKKVL